jgi:hypothetical protein
MLMVSLARSALDVKNAGVVLPNWMVIVPLPTGVLVAA